MSANHDITKGFPAFLLNLFIGVCLTSAQSVLQHAAFAHTCEHCSPLHVQACGAHVETFMNCFCLGFGLGRRGFSRMDSVNYEGFFFCMSKLQPGPAGIRDAGED